MPRIEDMLPPVDACGWSNGTQLETIGRRKNIARKPRIHPAIEFQRAEACIRDCVRREYQTAGFSLTVTTIESSAEAKIQIASSQRLGHSREMKHHVTTSDIAGAGR